jgi:hypothetical protein
MVPYVWTFGVVVYTNGGDRPRIPSEKIRDAIVAALPPGTGVGSITGSDHGIYEGPQGAST